MNEGARFYSPVHDGPGAHPAFYTGGTGSFPGAKGRGVNTLRTGDADLRF